MKTIGFVISHKENEKRRAITPEVIRQLKHPEHIMIEKGYGEVIGVSDDEFIKSGAKVVTRSEALDADIICDPKIGDADYLNQLENKTIFGWIHAVQNKDICDKICEGKLTAIAWEDMFKDGRHTFYRNNEIAGEAAVLHAFMCHGEFPYNKKVAVIGRGNTAMGAIKMLFQFSDDVTIYTRATEKELSKNIEKYDAIVNAILWDTNRRDHIISKEDLKRMKRGSLLIDISCDRAGAIETSIPTTIESPDYLVDGIRHYVVDHTPSLFYKSATEGISEAIAPYLDVLIEQEEDSTLSDATCIECGEIKDERIINFQKSHNLI